MVSSTIDIPATTSLPYSSVFYISFLIKMAHKYASKQPAGFKNYVENVAIVGVSSIRTLRV